MDRRPNHQAVAWFLENYTKGQLVLDPPYQRRTVWSPSYRRYFIDTVLRNFPSPAIFIDWQIKPGESTVYNVVDGKQRLTTLIDFTNDGFHLGDLFGGEGYDDPYWSDLSEDLQKRLMSYVLTVENISDASESELRDAFDRLNRNVAGLTHQELRHAQFKGDFIKRMEALAENPFWAEHRIFSPANVRRMRDVEFVSELFLLTMHGPIDGASRLLDSYYAEYEEEIPDEADHVASFDEILTWLDELPLDWTATRWRNMADLYSLWGALRERQADDDLPEPEAAAKVLTKFSKTQAKILEAERQEAKPPGTARDRRYYSNVRQGANKDAARTARIEALEEALASA
jgi:hypothetical protein